MNKIVNMCLVILVIFYDIHVFCFSFFIQCLWKILVLGAFFLKYFYKKSGIDCNFSIEYTSQNNHL